MINKQQIYNVIAPIFLSGKSKLLCVLCGLAFVVTGLIEAVWGLRQLYGFTHSQHNLFKITGSFFNPGPYSGWLAMVFPMALGCILTTKLHEVTQSFSLARLWRLCGSVFNCKGREVTQSSPLLTHNFYLLVMSDKLISFFNYCE